MITKIKTAKEWILFVCRGAWLMMRGVWVVVDSEYHHQLFHDGIFVPNKKISKYVIDSEFYEKLKRHPFVLITMYPFQ